MTGLAIGLVINATWQDDSWAVLRTFDSRFLWAAVGLLLFSWVVDGWRMQAMAKALGYTIPFRTSLRTNVLGYFLSAVTPFTAGGGALQVYSLSRAGLTVGHGTAAVLVSGFISQFGLALTGVALVFGAGITVTGDARLDQIIRIGVVVYAIVVAALVGLTWHIDKGRKFIAAIVQGVLKYVTDDTKVRRAERAVDKGIVDIHRGLHEMFGRRSPWALAGASLSVVFYTVQFAIVPVLALGLGANVLFPAFIAVQVPIYLLASVLPTPGGSGGLEFGLAGALLQFVTPAQVAVLVVVWRIITFYFVLALGGLAAVFFVRLELHRIAATRELRAPAPGAQTPPTNRTPPEPERAQVSVPGNAAPSTPRQTRNLGRY